jgi:hypothetical protein
MKGNPAMMTSADILAFRNSFAQLIAATRPPWTFPAFAVFDLQGTAEDGHKRWEFHRFHLDYEGSEPWKEIIDNKDDATGECIALVAIYRPKDCRATLLDAFQMGRFTALLGMPVWDLLVVDDEGGFASVRDSFPELRDALFCKHCGHYDVDGLSSATYQPTDSAVEWGTVVECHDINCEMLTKRMPEMPKCERDDLQKWRKKAAKVAASDTSPKPISKELATAN